MERLTLGVQAAAELETARTHALGEGAQNTPDLEILLCWLPHPPLETHVRLLHGSFSISKRFFSCDCLVNSVAKTKRIGVAVDSLSLMSAEEVACSKIPNNQPLNHTKITSNRRTTVWANSWRGPCAEYHPGRSTNKQMYFLRRQLRIG